MGRLYQQYKNKKSQSQRTDRSTQRENPWSSFWQIWRLDLLILDGLCYAPFSQEGAELLFQVLAERHERGSVIIKTNLGFADWTKIFGDANMTAALLDRLTHRAHIIECLWDSYRLQQT